MSDPHTFWREKAMMLLRAITAHYAPPATELSDLQDVLGVLRASPELRAQVARILDLRWAGRNAEFDEFVYALERAQRFDGAAYREFLYVTSGRRIQRDSIKATAREILQTLTD